MVLIPIFRRYILLQEGSNFLIIRICTMWKPHLAYGALIYLKVSIPGLMHWYLVIRVILKSMWCMIEMKKGISLVNMMSLYKMIYWYLTMRCLGVLVYVVHTWLGLDCTVFLRKEPLSLMEISSAAFT